MKKALIALAILSTTVAISQVVAPKQERKLSIELTVSETQMVIESLQGQPYNKVADLLQSIVSQANRQLKSDSTNKKK